MKTKPPPKGLGPRARRLWRELHGKYEFNEQESALFEVAVRSLGRLEAAETAVEEQGIIISDPSGRTRAHPGLGIIKEERLGFMRAMKALEFAVDESPARYHKIAAVQSRWQRHRGVS